MLDITLDPMHNFSNLVPVSLTSFNNQNANDQEESVFRSDNI